MTEIILGFPSETNVNKGENDNNNNNNNKKKNGKTTTEGGRDSEI